MVEKGKPWSVFIWEIGKDPVPICEEVPYKYACDAFDECYYEKGYDQDVILMFPSEDKEMELYPER